MELEQTYVHWRTGDGISLLTGSGRNLVNNAHGPQSGPPTLNEVKSSSTASKHMHASTLESSRLVQKPLRPLGLYVGASALYIWV